MDTKTEKAIQPLIQLWKDRDDQLDQRIIEWAGSNLSSESANALIAIVRNYLSAIDVKSELTTFAAILTQPATIN